MSKYNKAMTGSGPKSPLVSVATHNAVTYNGMKGALPDNRTELFKLAVNLFAGDEKTFYEDGKVRDKRFIALVEGLAIDDPTWTANLLIWLRTEGNMRTASLIGAAHFVHARLHNKNAIAEDEMLSSIGHMGLNRHVVSKVLARADEPGEFISYWMSTFGKLPKPVKRGIADAVLTQYTEYSTLKYDTDSHKVKFDNVLNLVHPKPSKPWQAELFKYILDKRYGNPELMGGDNLSMISANQLLRMDAAKKTSVLLDSRRVKEAGMTWEDVLSLAGSKLPKDKLWEAIIPSMGVMALIRNLRNFEEAGISSEARASVIAKITNPEVIAKSRQFPYRFLSAYDNTVSLHYKAALETALDLSTQNIPELDGYTLVLVDLSGSMNNKLSANSKMTRAEAGTIFGAALAARNPNRVTLVAYADKAEQVVYRAGESVLPLAKRIQSLKNSVGGGTNTLGALQSMYKKGHKRVIIITDEQANYNTVASNYWYNRYYTTYNTITTPLGKLCDDKTWMYSFNLGGYQVSQMETGSNRRYQLAGMTDHTFKMIPLLERGEEGRWPWEIS